MIARDPVFQATRAAGVGGDGGDLAARGVGRVDVVTLVDCVAGTSTEEHANAIKYDYPMFSKPMPSSELIGHLG